MEKKLPEKKFRAGAISATIWNNEVVGKDGQPAKIKSISFARNYKDKNDKWQTSNSLRAMDLPKAQLVLQKAFEYVSMSTDSISAPVEEMQV